MCSSKFFLRRRKNALTIEAWAQISIGLPITTTPSPSIEHQPRTVYHITSDQATFLRSLVSYLHCHISQMIQIFFVRKMPCGQFATRFQKSYPLIIVPTIFPGTTIPTSALLLAHLSQLKKVWTVLSSISRQYRQSADKGLPHLWREDRNYP